MFWYLFHALGIKKSSSIFSVSPAFDIGLTLAIAFILISSNFAIINAQQQQLTSQPGGTNNGAFATTSSPPPNTILKTFQSTNDSFRVQIPQDWHLDDVNNTGPAVLEETRLGYGMLAQLCPEQEIQPTFPNVNGSGGTSDCIASQNGVVHVIRYPDLETRIQPANNVTAYHLQKLQEVGYTNIQITNSTDMTVNLTMAQANQTIATLPAKFVEMTYITAASSAPNEIRSGYFLLTATNVTAPDVGITKGYAIFYEGNSNSSNLGATTPGITRTTTAASTGSLSSVPLPLPVKQVFDSFELIVAPEVEQAILQQQASVGQTGGGITTTTTTTTTGGGTTSGGGDLNCEDITERNFPIDPNNDPHGFDGDNDGIGCETGAFGEVIEPETGGVGNVGEDDDSDGEDSSCHPSYPDNCIPPPPPDLNCDDIGDTNFRVVGSDPHGFDGNDNDGIGCESGSGGGGTPDDDGEDDDADDNGGEDDNGGDDDCIIIGTGNVEDDCDETGGDDTEGGDDDDNGGDDDGGNEGGGEDDGGGEQEPEPEPEGDDGGDDDGGEGDIDG